MSRLILKSCTLRNWGTVADSSVSFPERGLVHVTGINLASRGAMESVASGKSLLGEAISRTLFDTPGRFTRLRDFSRDDLGNTYCAVNCELDGKPLLVELGYKCPELSKTGEGLRFTLGSDTPVMHGSVTNTRRDLAQILGVSEAVASWTVFVDGDRVDFARLSEANSVRLLMEVLNQPPWESYCIAARNRKNAFSTTLAKLSGQSTLLDGQIAAATAAIEAARQELVRKVEALETAVAAKDAADRARNAELDRLGSTINDCRQTEIRIRAEMSRLENQIAEQTAQLDREYHGAISAKAEADAELARLKSLVASLESTIARKGNEIDRRIAEWQAKESRRTSAAYNAAMATWRVRGKIADALAKLAEFRGRRTELEAELAEVSQQQPCRVGGCGRLVPPDESKAQAVKAKIDALDLRVAECTKQHDQLLAGIPTVLDGSEDLTDAGPEPQREADQLPPEDLCADLAQTKDGLERQLVDAKEAVEALRLRITQELQPNVETKRQALDGHRDLQEYQTLSRRLQETQASASTAQAEISRLQVEAAASNVAKETAAVSAAEDELNRRQRQLEQLTGQLQSVKVESADVTQLHKVCQYWETAFAPTGIPNMVIGTAISQLNVCARQIGHRLTAGALSVQYGNARALADGSRSNEIVLEVVNPHGSSKATGVSKGECGLVNLVVSETLSEIGLMANRVGYRWLDEVVGSQDQVVRRAIFSYFREMAETRGILIFMVDHSTEIAGYAPHSLVATKSEDGLTTYAWR